MSQENVEIVRRGHERMLRDGLPAMLDVLDPEVEWRAAQDTKSHVGPESVERSVNSFLEVWDEYAFEIEELIDAGDNVVVVIKTRGRGKGSGVLVENRYYRVCTVKDGRIVRMVEYSRKADAMEAAGANG